MPARPRPVNQRPQVENSGGSRDNKRKMTTVFCTERIPAYPFAEKIAANYMSARRRSDFIGVLESEDKPMSR